MTLSPHPSPHPHPGDPPPPAINTQALIADLANAQFSLAEVAARHALSLTDLTLLVASPDISDELAILHTFATERARFIAISNLPRAIGALTAVMTAIQRDETHHQTAPASAGEVARGSAKTGGGASTPAATSPSNPSSSPPVLIARKLETLRRAATTIIQLSRFTPRPWNPIPPSFLVPPEPAAISPALRTHAGTPPDRAPSRAQSQSISTPAPTNSPAASPPRPVSPPPKSKISNPQISNPWSPDPDPDDPNLVTTSAHHEHWP